MSRPVHIMRFAPADYVNDTVVKLALARRDLAASAFYPLFLFHSYIQGGSLPSDPALLAVVVGMRETDVRRALAFWVEHGKLVLDGPRVFHARVRREVAEEVAYRDAEAERKRLARAGRPEDAPRTSGGLPGGRRQESEAPTPLTSAVTPTSAVTDPAPLTDAPPRGPNGDPGKTAPRLSTDQMREYGREVARAWQDRRGPTNGADDCPSAAEWARISAWMEQGLPLAVVLEGIRNTGGKPRTLMACEPAVLEEYRRVGTARRL